MDVYMKHRSEIVTRRPHIDETDLTARPLDAAERVMARWFREDELCQRMALMRGPCDETAEGTADSLGFVPLRTRSKRATWTWCSARTEAGQAFGTTVHGGPPVRT
ncbi:hypothetical protein J8273_4658 [Carpediemonas membranifera]|uniref:Uncharacterized protein n=1 Tax=Carpediemonas membranifera TaxID=201153 RepID=A0A8J6AX91_9EUKA|nr:hypothetical protein J8273_4658 [Carpediemonas membranifera]|eukprot:KAG9393795.1 hypothetical protein J8273_4658 [Carpediemonas membranifera]